MSAPAPAVSYSASTKTTITALNSTIIYLLAYMLAQGFYQVATVLMAWRLSIPGVWYMSSIKFTIADPEWWRSGVLAVYGIGPAVCATMGVAAGLWFWHRARRKRGLFKLFLVWLTLHCCNLVLGVQVADSFTESWAWYIPSWLFMIGSVPNIMVAIVSGMVQIVFGYFAAIGFLQSHDSMSIMRYDNRRRLILGGIIVPWLGGSLFLTILKAPDLSTTEVLHWATMSLLLLPMAVKCTQDLFDATIPAPQKTRLAVGLLSLAGGVCLVWRLVLASGLHF